MHSGKSKSRGRNVINIKQIKEYLAYYANKNKLPESISVWLQKNFLRWVINYFPYIQSVQSKERYSSLIKGAIPDWFRPQDEKIEFIYIDVKHRKFQEILKKCVEFLASRNKNIVHKFPRMSVPQVLDKWEEEHQRFATRQKIYKETSQEALKKLFTFEKFNVVKFDYQHKELSLEMARESALMQHCLGEFDDDILGKGGYGEYYINLIREQKIELFSIRDEKNMPHVTIALYKDDGKYWLEQIKGKQNSAPVERYIPASIAFLNFLNVHYPYHADTLAMGVVNIDGVSKRIEEIQDERIEQFLIAYNPRFIHKLNSPSKSTLWLATLRDPNIAEVQNKLSDAMKISALLQQNLLMLKVKFTLNITAKEILKSIQKYKISSRIFRFIKLQVGRV